MQQLRGLKLGGWAILLVTGLLLYGCGKSPAGGPAKPTPAKAAPATAAPASSAPTASTAPAGPWQPPRKLLANPQLECPWQATGQMPNQTWPATTCGWAARWYTVAEAQPIAGWVRLTGTLTYATADAATAAHPDKLLATAYLAWRENGKLAQMDQVRVAVPPATTGGTIFGYTLYVPIPLAPESNVMWLRVRLTDPQQATATRDLPMLKLCLPPPPTVTDTGLAWKPLAAGPDVPRATVAVRLRGTAPWLAVATLTPGVQIPLPAGLAQWPLETRVYSDLLPDAQLTVLQQMANDWSTHPSSYSFVPNPTATAPPPATPPSVVGFDPAAATGFTVDGKAPPTDKARWEKRSSLTYQGRAADQGYFSEDDTLLFTFTPPGSAAPVTLRQPSAPLPQKVRSHKSDAGGITTDWDKTAFAASLPRYQVPPMLELRRTDARGVVWAVTTVPADFPPATYRDTTALREQEYTYELWVCRGWLRGQAWISGVGVVPAFTEINLPADQRAAGAGAVVGTTGTGKAASKVANLDELVANAGGLGILVVRSELCFAGTGVAHLRAYRELLTQLRALNGVHLREGYAAYALSAYGLAGFTSTPENATKGYPWLPCQVALRLVDYSRWDDEGVELYGMDLLTRHEERLGKVALSGTIEDVRQQLMQPLQTFLAPYLKLAATPPAAGVAPVGKAVPAGPTTLVLAGLYPIEQLNPYCDGPALADTLATDLAAALPSIPVVRLDGLTKLFADRHLSDPTTPPRAIRSGDVLLLGRVWQDAQQKPSYLITATSLATGELLGTWNSPPDSPAAHQELARWCQTLHPTPILSVPDQVRQLLAEPEALAQRPLTPGDTGAMPPLPPGVLPAGDAQASVMNQMIARYNDLVQAGKDNEGRDLLLNVWLQKDTLSAKDQSQLPHLAIILARAYENAGYTGAAAALYDWYLAAQADVSGNHPAYAGFEVRADLVQVSRDNCARAAAARHAPIALPTPQAALTAAPAGSYLPGWLAAGGRDATGRLFTVRDLSWPRPALNVWMDCDRVVKELNNRPPTDPLNFERPYSLPTCRLNGSRWAKACAAYLLADPDTYARDVQRLLGATKTLAALHPATGAPPSVMAPGRLPGATEFQVQIGSKYVQSYAEYAIKCWQIEFCSEPYVMQQVYRQLPLAHLRLVIGPLAAEADSTTIDTMFEGRLNNFLPSVSTYFAADLLATAGDTTARLKAEAYLKNARHKFAIFQRVGLDGVLKENRNDTGADVCNANHLYNATLALAAASDPAAKALFKDDDFLQRFFFAQFGSKEMVVEKFSYGRRRLDPLRAAMDFRGLDAVKVYRAQPPKDAPVQDLLTRWLPYRSRDEFKAVCLSLNSEDVMFHARTGYWAYAGYVMETNLPDHLPED